MLDRPLFIVGLWRSALLTCRTGSVARLRGSVREAPGSCTCLHSVAREDCISACLFVSNNMSQDPFDSLQHVTVHGKSSANAFLSILSLSRFLNSEFKARVEICVKKGVYLTKSATIASSKESERFRSIWKHGHENFVN